MEHEPFSCYPPRRKGHHDHEQGHAQSALCALVPHSPDADPEHAEPDCDPRLGTLNKLIPAKGHATRSGAAEDRGTLVRGMTLVELYRHNTWATLRLIEYCQDLNDEHMNAAIPGTYGTIRDTLRHLVDAEEGYFADVTGERFSEPLPDGPVPLEELAERIRRLGPGWEVLAQDAAAQSEEIITEDGSHRMPRAVPMAQAIHHANDHRTHILSILGTRGLDDPGLSVWRYARSAGQMQKLG
jgi:uncharacterized damage-inducible protein DinB